ncbi:30S ribosomal protein S18 [Mycoplasmopsis agassizii]|uniref:Small ribosomal subunit protein bS18 n=1 Tax=Mycoplasmopsis agassizii TaxID=33922 RepID=A0A269TIF7_9BACT|nr:30S ribosomal protein S18 [Mycoplasmopsis agassizii]PAK20960.1 30S ribosomal protein S18 [Mycoplasmopsis agassizii]
MAFVKKSKGKKVLKRKRISQLDQDGINYIDYKDVDLLLKYINTHGRILPSKITAVSAKRQRLLTVAIKRAREMALIPYKRERVRSNRPLMGKRGDRQAHSEGQKPQTPEATASEE